LEQCSQEVSFTRKSTADSFRRGRREISLSISSDEKKGERACLLFATAKRE
jgi:hypothetical protein